MLDGIQKVFNTCFRFTELLFVEGEIDIFSVKQIQDCGNDGLDGSIIVQHIHANHVKTDLFEPGRYSPEDVLRAAEQFFGGGTDFEAPLTEAMRLMEKGYENADITIITDGECRISGSFAESFRNAMLKYKATVTGILLDKDRPCGKTLEPFCDNIYHSKELTEEEIAQQIIRSRA